MPKTKISEFSATPGNNTDIDGINISEGCAPSGINDAIRELMAQLKDFQAGTAGDSFNGPIGSTTPAAGTFTNLSASGTFALTGDQVQISEGGTGQTTANAAFNALAPSQASNAGKYLKTDGTNTSWDALDISTADITGTLPIANGGTGLTALGTGVQTALGQNVTGSGGIVLASSPSLTTPNLGTPSAVTLTNATGLPLSTGVTGTLGTTNGGTGLTSFTANRVFYSSSTSAIGSSANLTFDGTTLTAANFTDSSLTSGRVTYATTGGNLTDSANLLYSGTDLTVYGITVGRGAGASGFNTVLGSGALATNSTGIYATAVGVGALNKSTASGNTAVGAYSATNTTGADNSAFGADSLGTNTTGANNTALGRLALFSNTTASENTAVGYQAGYGNTTGIRNTAVGAVALFTNTTGGTNDAFGYKALEKNTTASNNVALGAYSLQDNTTGASNAASGQAALNKNTTGSNNTAHGYFALYSNTTASNNTAVGYQALYSNTTAADNTALGLQAGYSNTTGTNNVFVGNQAGYSITTGFRNTFIGGNNGNAFYGAGGYITTGSRNTIIGCYNGNQGGLDIRTASNYIVLSDGDGNPREIIDGSGNAGFGVVPSAWQSTRKAVQVGDTSVFAYGGNQTSVGNNFFINSSGVNSYIKASTYAHLYIQGSDGAHEWYTAPNTGTAGGTASFTRLLAVNTGNSLALQGANSQSGTGITFPATQSASSNANTLDDYEEGSWTPVLTGESTAGSYTFVVSGASYTKIGNQVTVWCSLVDITQSSAGSGNILITGLPFTIADTASFDRSPTGALHIRQLGTAVTGAKGTYVIGARNSTKVYPLYFDGTTEANFTIAQISSGATDIGFSFSYQI